MFSRVHRSVSRESPLARMSAMTASAIAESLIANLYFADNVEFAFNPIRALCQRYDYPCRQSNAGCTPHARRPKAPQAHQGTPPMVSPRSGGDAAPVGLW